jgi:hypothetical protein
MKNMFYILLVLLTGCSFDVPNAEYSAPVEDNTFYSVKSSGVISGDLFYKDIQARLEDEFSYSEYTESKPYLIFYNEGDPATISIIYNGVEYTETGTGYLAITLE